MQPTLRRAASALAMLAAHGLADAAVEADAARDLIQKSGLWTQLASIGTQVRSGLDSAGANGHAKLEPEQRQRLATCAQGAYAVDRMRASAVEVVAAALSSTDLPPLQAWYGGATGRKVTALEEAASALGGDPRERLRLGAAKWAEAGTARQSLLQSALDETRSVQFMVDTMIDVTLAVQQGAARADPNAAGPSAADLRATLEQQRPQLTDRYGQILQALFAFNYAGLSDAELRQYVDFLGTPAGKGFTEAGMRAMARALQGGSVQLGRCIQEARSSHGS